jgi:flagellar biosynthesis component FlhA
MAVLVAGIPAMMMTASAAPIVATARQEKGDADHDDRQQGFFKHDALLFVKSEKLRREQGRCHFRNMLKR